MEVKVILEKLKIPVGVKVTDVVQRTSDIADGKMSDFVKLKREV
jgi:hypothetical protein